MLTLLLSVQQEVGIDTFEEQEDQLDDSSFYQSKSHLQPLPVFQLHLIQERYHVVFFLSIEVC
jgi:hypothetical protein